MKHVTHQLGVHISDQDISLVAMASRNEQVEITGWQYEPLEAGFVRGGRIQEPNAILTILTKFIKLHKLHVATVTFSLTINVARLKVSRIKATSDEDLHEQVMQELERYTPYGHENTYATYRVLSSDQAEDGKIPVMEFMTSRGAGNICLAVSKGAKLFSPTMEAAVFPLLRAVRYQQGGIDQGVMLLALFDADAGMMCVLKDGNLEFCRNIELGMQDLQGDIICKEQLQQVGEPLVRYAQGMTNEDLVMYVAGNGRYEALRKMVMRIRQSFKNVKVRQLSSVQISTALEIEHNPQNKEIPIFALSAALTPQVQTDDDEEPVNLIAPESLNQVTVQREATWVGKAIAAIVILAIAAIVPVHMKTKSVKAYQAEYESQIATTIPVQAKIEATQKKIRAIEKEIKNYQLATDTLEVLPWTDLLRVLVKHAPGGMRLMDFTSGKGGDFELGGKAIHESLVHQYVENLQAESLVEDAEAEEVIYDSLQRNRLDFRISGKLNSAEETTP